MPAERSLLPRLVLSSRNRLRTAAARARSLPLQVLRLVGVVDVGRGLQVGRGVDIELYGRLVIGDDVVLQDHCQLRVGPGAVLVLGDGALVGRGTVIAASSDIHVGAYTMIAEHCTVRDSDHLIDPEARRNETVASVSSVHLGRDVWLGAGCRVLKGATIGDGTVVAANAVVKGELPPRVIAAGTPARVIRAID